MTERNANKATAEALLGPAAEEIKRLSQRLHEQANSDPERLIALKAYVDLHAEMLATAIAAVFIPPARHEIVRQVSIDIHGMVQASMQRGI